MCWILHRRMKRRPRRRALSNTLCGAGVGGRKGINTNGYRIMMIRLKIRLVLKPRIRHVKVSGFVSDAAAAATAATAADVVSNRRRFLLQRGGRRKFLRRRRQIGDRGPAGSGGRLAGGSGGRIAAAASGTRAVDEADRITVCHIDIQLARKMGFRRRRNF